MSVVEESGERRISAIKKSVTSCRAWAYLPKSCKVLSQRTPLTRGGQADHILLENLVRRVGEHLVDERAVRRLLAHLTERGADLRDRRHTLEQRRDGGYDALDVLPIARRPLVEQLQGASQWGVFAVVDADGMARAFSMTGATMRTGSRWSASSWSAPSALASTIERVSRSSSGKLSAPASISLR